LGGGAVKLLDGLLPRWAFKRRLILWLAGAVDDHVGRRSKTLRRHSGVLR